MGAHGATLTGLRAAAYGMLLVFGADEASVGLMVVGGRWVVGILREGPHVGSHIYCYCL